MSGWLTKAMFLGPQCQLSGQPRSPHWGSKNINSCGDLQQQTKYKTSPRVGVTQGRVQSLTTENTFREYHILLTVHHLQSTTLMHQKDLCKMHQTTSTTFFLSKWTRKTDGGHHRLQFPMPGESRGMWDSPGSTQMPTPLLRWIAPQMSLKTECHYFVTQHRSLEI